MDSLITAAARTLAAGDPLSALQRVALRNDPPALALRGIALAQLGEFTRAQELLRKAARAFGASEPLARARCIAAHAETALAALLGRIADAERSLAQLDLRRRSQRQSARSAPPEIQARLTRYKAGSARSAGRG